MMSSMEKLGLDPLTTRRWASPANVARDSARRRRAEKGERTPRRRSQPLRRAGSPHRPTLGAGADRPLSPRAGALRALLGRGVECRHRCPIDGSGRTARPRDWGLLPRTVAPRGRNGFAGGRDDLRRRLVPSLRRELGLARWPQPPLRGVERRLRAGHQSRHLRGAWSLGRTAGTDQRPHRGGGRGAPTAPRASEGSRSGHRRHQLGIWFVPPRACNGDRRDRGLRSRDLLHVLRRRRLLVESSTVGLACRPPSVGQGLSRQASDARGPRHDQRRRGSLVGRGVGAPGVALWTIRAGIGHLGVARESAGSRARCGGGATPPPDQRRSDAFAAPPGRRGGPVCRRPVRRSSLQLPRPMTYDFKYGEDTPYARAVALLGRHRRPGGALVLDLGCGYGAIAEPVARLALTFWGAGAEPASTDALVRRGFEAAVGDLAAPESLTIDLERAIADRPVAAICMLDVIEHLSDPEAALARLWDLAQRLGAPPLVVSIPNVTHLDLGVKLLLGRWDVTPTGLLDATHLRFFSEAHLNETMGRTGWTEIESADFELTVSDQHFPPDAVPLERSTPVGSFLTTLREHAGPGALVNQFVRAYRPEGPPRPVAPDARAGGPETLAPWVSVLVRTRAQRPDTFQETLLCLAAQTCDDFEVLVLAHDVAAERLEEIQALIDQFDQTFSRRVRVVSVHGGGRSRPLNEAARPARGRYLATLDDDALAFAHWVESLKATALRAPGRVLHIGVANQPIADQAGTDGYTVVARPQPRYHI